MDGEPGGGSIVADGAVWTPGRGVIHVTDIETRAVTHEIVVGPFPQRPLELDGLLWVVNRFESVSVIDIESRSVIDTVSVSAEFLEAAIEVDGEVWFSSSGAVHVIDPATRSLVETIEVGRGTSIPIFHAGTVWVASFEDGMLRAIDPASRSVTHTVDVGARPVTPSASGDSVFVLSDLGLTRVDAADPGSVTEVEAPLSNSYRPVVAGDDLWIISNKITVVDQALLAVVDENQRNPGGSLAVHDGIAWFVDAATGELVGIDVETREVVLTTDVGRDATTPFVSDGLVWVADPVEGTLTVTEIPQS